MWARTGRRRGGRRPCPAWKRSAARDAVVVSGPPQCAAGCGSGGWGSGRLAPLDSHRCTVSVASCGEPRPSELPSRVRAAVDTQSTSRPPTRRSVRRPPASRGRRRWRSSRALRDDNCRRCHRPPHRTQPSIGSLARSGEQRVARRPPVLRERQDARTPFASRSWYAAAVDPSASIYKHR